MEFSLKNKLGIKKYFKRANKKKSGLTGGKITNQCNHNSYIPADNFHIDKSEVGSSSINYVTDCEKPNLVTVSKSDTEFTVTIDVKNNKIKSKESKKRKLDNENISDGDEKHVKISHHTKNVSPKVVPSSLIKEFSGEWNEETEMKILLNYQKNLNNVEMSLLSFLKDFGSHIKFSRISSTKSDAHTKDSTMKTMNRSHIFRIEERLMKMKFKSQLLSMQNSISIFLKTFFQDTSIKTKINRPTSSRKSFSTGYKIQKRVFKRIPMKMRPKTLYDMPGLREAMLNLFHNSTDDEESSFSGNNITDFMSESDY